MPYAEVIYETGSKSVVSYDSEDELREALGEQHRRAISGQNGGPAGHNAERVKKVLLYDEHPADYNQGGTLSASDVSRLVSSLAVGGEVSANELISALRGEVDPTITADTEEKHGSIFKAEENGELDLAFLKSVEDGEV